MLNVGLIRHKHREIRHEANGASASRSLPTPLPPRLWEPLQHAHVCVCTDCKVRCLSHISSGCCLLPSHPRPHHPRIRFPLGRQVPQTSALNDVRLLWDSSGVQEAGSGVLWGSSQRVTRVPFLLEASRETTRLAFSNSWRLSPFLGSRSLPARVPSALCFPCHLFFFHLLLGLVKGSTSRVQDHPLNIITSAKPLLPHEGIIHGLWGL